MTDRSRVLVAVRVDTSPQRAFDAFTKEISTWWQPNGLFQISEGRTGALAFEPGPQGRLVETHADGSTFTVGRVRVWQPPDRLVVSWRHESFSADQETELSVRFEAVGEQTRVTVEHFGWDSIPAEHAARHGLELAVFQLRFAQWWQDMLGTMAQSIDRRGSLRGGA